MSESQCDAYLGSLENLYISLHIVRLVLEILHNEGTFGMTILLVAVVVKQLNLSR